MNDIIRIGTRKSALALIQTQLVADELRQVCPGIQVEIVTKDTLGDRILDKPLQEFGGKGVFVSEFEQAIQEGVIDLAVHSAKDLPMELAQGLTIAAVSGREDPRDVLVTMRGHRIGRRAWSISAPPVQGAASGPVDVQNTVAGGCRGRMQHSQGKCSHPAQETGRGEF